MIATDKSSFVGHEDAPTSPVAIHVPTTGELATPGVTEDFRAVCYSEALTAIGHYISEDLVSPPDEETLRFLGTALVRMMGERQDFGPEDFTLYSMSVLHHDMASDDDVQEIRRGAMRYLLDVKDRLSPEFQSLEEDARAFLRETPDPVRWQSEDDVDRVPRTAETRPETTVPTPYRRMSADVPADAPVARPRQPERRSPSEEGEARGVFMLIFMGLLAVSAVYVLLLLSIAD
ncbi:MAG: hypothetical protein AAGA06_09155 [Pseudomonadota bacterium]